MFILPHFEDFYPVLQAVFVLTCDTLFPKLSNF